MTPEEVSRLRPSGSDGATEYETTAPPPDDGVLAVMAAPLVYTAGLAEYERLLGAAVPLSIWAGCGLPHPDATNSTTAKRSARITTNYHEWSDVPRHDLDAARSRLR